MATATTTETTKVRKSKKGTLRITPEMVAWAKANGHEMQLTAAVNLVAAYRVRNDSPEKLQARIAKAEKALKADKAKLNTAKAVAA